MSARVHVDISPTSDLDQPLYDQFLLTFDTEISGEWLVMIINRALDEEAERSKCDHVFIAGSRGIYCKYCGVKI